MAATPRVRVMIVAPAPERAGAPAPGLAHRLQRLGDEAALEVVHDLAAARAARESAEPDIVVADEAIGPGLLDWIAADRGPDRAPVLVVARGGGSDFALEAFRAGASDCLLAGAETGDALCAAVLDTIASDRVRRERTRAERLGREVGALERTTDRIVSHLTSALLVVEPDGRIRFGNPAAAAVVGLPEAELAGARFDRFFRGQAEASFPVRRTLERGEAVRGAETALNRADGRAVPVGLSSAPLEDEAGATEGAVVIFQDLTEFKQLEQQVLQNEKMASIGQLAAGVAHEINNPMGFIHANLCQLLEYLEDFGKVWDAVSVLRHATDGERMDPEAVRAAARELGREIAAVDADFLLDDFGKAIRESLEGSERIRAIVKDLREFSHQDSGERSWTDVNKALDSTANIVWTMMKHSVELRKRYGELPPVSCHPVQLKQVFMNLLMNAYQAIEERKQGEPELHGEIRIRTEAEGEGVRIVVSDNGAGIPEDVLPRIFDPFFTTKEVGVGTGLGLSTAFNLVERHAGTIQADSRPGEGTTFRVWLPVGEAAA